MAKIELHSAFFFDCDWCGKENLVRALTGDLTEECAAEIADTLESEFDEAMHFEALTDKGEWGADELVTRVVMAPKIVKCAKCGTEYTAELPHD